MSSAGLKMQVLGIIKNNLKRYASNAAKDMRAVMDTENTAFEVSPEIIIAGSIHILKFTDGTTKKVKLSSEHASYVAEAMYSYFSSKYPKLTKEEFKKNLKNMLPKENPKERQKYGPNITESRLSGKTRLRKAFFIPISSNDSFILLGLNFDKVKRAFNEFTAHFKKMLKDQGPDGNGFLTRKDYDTLFRHFGTRVEKNKSGVYRDVRNTELGHIGNAEDVARASVTERSFKKAISTIQVSQLKDATEAEIANLNALKKEITSEIERQFHAVHAEYSVSFKKEDLGISKKNYDILGKLDIVVAAPHFWKTNNFISGQEQGVDVGVFSRNDKGEFQLDKSTLKGLPFWEASPSIFSRLKSKISKAFIRAFDAFKHSKHIFVKSKSTIKNVSLKASITKTSGKIKPDREKFYSPPIGSYSPSLEIETEEPFQSTAGCGISLDRLLRAQGLINSTLAGALISNMGDEGYPGGQREILNNRTGTFAGSVEITSMTPDPTNCKVVASYDYQRDPYSIFDKGGRLWTPTRDIQKLIGGTIREMAVSMLEDKYAIVPRRI